MKQHMKQRIFWTISILAIAIAAGCYFFPKDTDVLSQRYAPNQLQQDFQVFREVLEKAHPALYSYADKNELNHDFDSIYAGLKDDADIRSFHQKLAFIVNKIGCSHTNLYLPKILYDTLLHRPNFFPLPVVYVDGGFYINSDISEIPVGSHIISINGNPAAQIMERMYDYNVPDGRNKNYNLSQAAQHFSYDYFMAYGPAGVFRIEYVAPGSTTREMVALEPVTLEKYTDEYNTNVYYNYSDEVGYDFEIIDSLHTAVLTLRSFAFSTATTFSAYKNFLLNAFTLLKNENGINNLVIDCRNNEGGEYENIFLLLRFLSKQPFREVDSAKVRFRKTPYQQYLEPAYALNERPYLDSMLKTEFHPLGDGTFALNETENDLRRPHPMAFTGNLFVITNSNVVSAASNFVAMIKDSKRGIIVGEQTGGGYNAHNGFTRLLYKLPNTGMQLEFSAVQVQHFLHHPQFNRYGVEPDYTISNTIHDIIENQDPQMSFIVNNLVKADR